FRPSTGPDRAAVRQRAGIPATAPLVVAAGRLVRKKGFEYLIDALPMAGGNVQLVIAGDGDLAVELDARARSGQAADRIRFVGNLSQDAVGEWFAAADVVAVPSVRDESGNVDGLPNTLLEGLASGTPLVATAAGGIGAVVEHDRSALIVPEKDSGALAEAIRALIADVGLRTRLGREGRALVERQFGWDAAAARFEMAYDRALAFKSLTR
ncbi:MAG TPA: glycosyltransferase family 4 protein, partial [Vicinamibacterales bacterium]